MRVGATGALVQLARTGCTTTMDHHYVFPAGGATCSARRSRPRAPSACGSCRPAARWTSAGAGAGCRPSGGGDRRDPRRDADAIDRHHDPSPDSMLRVGVAPCSPFSVTGDLLEQAAALARDKGVRLHTRRDHGRGRLLPGEVRLRPSSTSSRWAGSARTCGSRTSTSTTRASPPWPPAAPASRTALVQRPAGRRHLPHPRPARRRRPGRPRRRRGRVQRGGVAGRGGSATRCCSPGGRRAAGAHRPRRLELATIGGAGARLGRPDRLAGGRQARRPRALAGRHRRPRRIEDPVAALVLGTPPPLELLLVQGRPVVRHDAMVDVDEERLAVDVRAASETLLGRAVGS